MRTKYCEHIIEEGEEQGQRCNQPFQVNFAPANMHKKYCDEHSSDKLQSGLSRSKNIHAIQSNNEKMHDWIKSRMVIQPRRDAELAEMITTIARMDLTLVEFQHQDETRICNIIDQNLMTILITLGILDEGSELTFATKRNILTVQGQIRELGNQLTVLDERIAAL